MGAYRGGGQFQVLGDALHGGASSEAYEYLELALREALDRGFRGAFDVGESELLRQADIDIAAAGGDGRDRLEEGFGGAALGKESKRALTKRPARMHGIVMRR